MKIGKYLKQEGYKRVALFWGEGVKELFGETIHISLISAEVTVVHEEVVHTNNIDDAFDAGKRLPYRTEAVVAVGGGKAIDYCKYVAFNKQLPLTTVPTLISNDAFASPTSSLMVNGKRTSVKTTVPHGVIIDTAVIAKAPQHFIYSGIGDLFCKTTAVFDWKLAYKSTGEPVNDFAATVATTAADTCTYFTNKDLANVEYIGIIASSLLMTGVAMIIAGSSRPASGAEHMISHAYDRVAKKPSLHGLQVGVASYAVSYLQGATYERIKRDITESGFYDFMCKNPLSKADFIQAIMMAPDMKENYYTVLSERGALQKLVKFVEEDELLAGMLA